MVRPQCKLASPYVRTEASAHDHRRQHLSASGTITSL